MTQIFISWSGNLGKKIAEFLHKDLFRYANLKPWISSNDITAGNAWFNETAKALSESEYGVVCLTPGVSKKPWINFEIGWLYGKLNNCKIITFGENIDNPLACLQKRDGYDIQTWFGLIREMIPKELRTDEEIQDRVQLKFSKLEELLELINQEPYQYYCELDQQFSKIHDVMNRLKKNDYAQHNFLFQRVITKSFADLIYYFDNLQSTYSIPASEYVKYLIYLQEEVHPKPTVKAIALVDIEEDFWRFPAGNKIKNSSNPESIRVFVFTKKEDLQSYFPILKEHARKYHVYTISLTRLHDVIGDKSKDFSIIYNSEKSLLATYQNETDWQNKISFISNILYIQDYEKSFDDLIKSNFITRVEKDFEYTEEDIINLSRKVFYGLTLYPRKPVEMSLYINVFDYDDHESKHAYYSEMTTQMISSCKEDYNSKSLSQPLEILELGAGTGIFTMMVANAIADKLRKIDAIEFDWHCYKLLKIKTREFANSHPNIDVNVYHEDSRTYDPEGKFNYIFSAFADHHIKSRDKEIYFENVKNNLQPGGLMIVGDEFLREHNADNKEERNRALRDYHSHIIKIAESESNFVLAELERQALDSGLEEKGDFKVSCSQYENFIRNAGFKVKKKIKIGPLNRDDIGGIYVYVCSSN
ncbi:MAG: methyltransferase domain-containing protein [Symploca sp. SIO1C2]|nr:methyltransferase domain-containing protein [Symploca sp. SIO1C2]